MIHMTDTTPDARTHALFTTDADILDDLREAGIELEPLESDTDLAQLSAVASRHLRALAHVRAERAQTMAAMKAELEMIERAYRPQFAANQKKDDYLVAQIEGFAAMADALSAFEKKKKLITAGGAFGKKATPEKLVIEDPDALIEWAMRELPALVKAETKHTVPHAALSAAFKAGQTGGEVPPGVVRVEAGEKWVVEPTKPEAGA